MRPADGSGFPWWSQRPDIPRLACGDHDRTRRTGRSHPISYREPEKRRAAQRAAHARRMIDPEYRQRYNNYHREYRKWHPQANTRRVDHDHVTGGIRDLLCTNCNMMCGQSGDKPERLDAAAK